MAETQPQPQKQLTPSAIVAHVAAALGVPFDGCALQVHVPRPIEPTAIYDEAAAEAVTNTSYETRYRAVKKGKLVCRRIGSRRLYLGSDLLAWIGGKPAGGQDNDNKR